MKLLLTAVLCLLVGTKADLQDELDALCSGNTVARRDTGDGSQNTKEWRCFDPTSLDFTQAAANCARCDTNPNGGGEKVCAGIRTGAHSGHSTALKSTIESYIQTYNSGCDDTAVCKDTSVDTGFDTFEWEYSVRVKFDNFNTYNYPSVVLSSTGAFQLHGMGPGYGGNKGHVGFYIVTKSGIGAHGRGVGELTTTQALTPGQWYTLRIQKGRRFISMAVDDTPPVIAILSSDYTDEQFEMTSPGLLTLGDGTGGHSINGQVEDFCWKQRATFCGAEISPLNANDYSSRAAMAHWDLNVEHFQNFVVSNDYIADGYTPADVFTGFHSGAGVGDVSYTMNVDGVVTLTYGRAYNNGNVRVHLNDVEISRTEEKIFTIDFEVAAGDVIKIDEHDTSIVAIYNIKVCSSTAAPTATPTATPTTAVPTGTPTAVPTGTPTAAPTGVPTGTPTDADANTQADDSASFGGAPRASIGADGDTVYKCDAELCFKNVIDNRGTWDFVDATDAGLAGSTDFTTTGVTTDGTWTVNDDFASLSFKDSATEDQLTFPTSCACGK